MRRLSSSGYAVREFAIPDRLELESPPRSETVDSFILTRAAERSWRKFNEQLGAGRGALWWISGPASCGKTHFLNYLMALQQRAGAMLPESSRSITCGFELAGRVGVAELEAYLLNVIAEQIGARGEASELWRAMRAAVALEVALEQAARVGIHALTIAIDFGNAECRSIDDYIGIVAKVAAGAKRSRLNVILAARERGPRSAEPLEVAPADSSECVSAAITRTRELVDGTDADSAYAGLETLGFDSRAIYPFHPRAVAALTAVAGRPATFAAIARIAREVLRAHGSDPQTELVFPADLIASASLNGHLAARLGESGSAAMTIARDAARTLVGNESVLAREIVDTLIVEHLAGAFAPLSTIELEARVPTLAARRGEAWTRPVVQGVLQRLAVQTRGVIRSDSEGARFDPSAAADQKLRVSIRRSHCRAVSNLRLDRHAICRSWAPR